MGYFLRELGKNQIKQIRSLQTKKRRVNNPFFLIEGLYLCQEALEAKSQIEKCIISKSFLPDLRSNPLFKFIEQRNIPTFTIPDNDLKNLSDTTSPQGIAMIVKKPHYHSDEVLKKARSNILLLDDLQDPGNVGTIIRTARWFGIDAIFLSKHSVECFNSKVVRATMGAIFYMPFFEDNDLSMVIEDLRYKKYKIFASVRENGRSITTVKKPEKTAVLIGNESQGIDQKLLRLCDEKITILSRGSGDSLNAAIACGIILYEMNRHE
jgi:TrmH family RNA methyltransferase